jgi:hypothetical protein
MYWLVLVAIIAKVTISPLAGIALRRPHTQIQFPAGSRAQPLPLRTKIGWLQCPWWLDLLATTTLFDPSTTNCSKENTTKIGLVALPVLISPRPA